MSDALRRAHGRPSSSLSRLARAPAARSEPCLCYGCSCTVLLLLLSRRIALRRTALLIITGCSASSGIAERAHMDGCKVTVSMEPAVDLARNTSFDHFRIGSHPSRGTPRHLLYVHRFCCMPLPVGHSAPTSGAATIAERLAQRCSMYCGCVRLRRRAERASATERSACCARGQPRAMY